MIEPNVQNETSAEPVVTGTAAAIAAARNHRSQQADPDAPVTLSTGIKAYIRGVPPALIDDATSGIQDPQVPFTYDEEKGREIENPFDPAYLAAQGEAAKQRGIAAMDVMVMFGVELVDPVPPKETWLKRLTFLAKRGTITFDPSIYDLEDQVELEFVYKRYIAVAGGDLSLISERSGIVSKEAIRKAEATF